MAAAEALIVLSLLGCDDSGAQCDFVRVGPERYETVEACRAASEPLLAASAMTPAETAEAAKTNLQPAPFPPAPPKAGEETPQTLAGGELPAPDGATPPADEPELIGKEPGLLSRVADALSALAPEKETITKPIDIAADGAAKVGGAVIVGVKRVADAVNPF